VKDGRESSSHIRARSTPKPGNGIRKAIRDRFNYRIQLGYTRYFLPGSFYRPTTLPNHGRGRSSTPSDTHDLTVDLLAHASPRIARLQDRFARWRRNTWFRNEMGDRDAHFKAAETFRR